MRLAGEDWEAFFDAFHRSAWRLETHPVYTMPFERETFARFLAGEKPTNDHAMEWVEDIRRYRATGRTIGRVRLVAQPLSDYIRYEFDWWYQFSVAAGEDIRILDLTDRANPGLPDEDFWMMDETHIVQMIYRPDGTQVGRELIEDPDIEAFINYRDVALNLAVPFRQYWPD